jgi:hypothetical protein
MTENLQALLNELARILQQINNTLFDFWPIAIAVGIALCFFGFKLFRFSVFFFGFVIGATIGLGIGDLMIKPWGGIIGSVIVGLLGGYGFLLIIRIAGFIIGVVLGGTVGVFFLGESVWVIPTAILSGLCAFFLLRFFIMASTSCWGALLAIGGFSRLLNLPIGEHPDLMIISETVLFAVGLGYQVFYYNRKS